MGRVADEDDLLVPDAAARLENACAYFYAARVRRRAVQVAADALYGYTSTNVVAEAAGAPHIADLDATVWLEGTPARGTSRSPGTPADPAAPVSVTRGLTAWVDA